MPIYEYECRKCGATSSFFEKMDEWGFWKRKCSQCGSRRLSKILSTFTPTASRSTVDQMNELKQMGNVQFVPRQSNPWGDGPPPGGCPYENAEKDAAAKAEQNKPAGSYEISSK